MRLRWTVRWVMGAIAGVAVLTAIGRYVQTLRQRSRDYSQMAWMHATTGKVQGTMSNRPYTGPATKEHARRLAIWNFSRSAEYERAASRLWTDVPERREPVAPPAVAVEKEAARSPIDQTAARSPICERELYTGPYPPRREMTLAEQRASPAYRAGAEEGRRMARELLEEVRLKSELGKKPKAEP